MPSSLHRASTLWSRMWPNGSGSDSKERYVTPQDLRSLGRTSAGWPRITKSLEFSFRRLRSRSSRHCRRNLKFNCFKCFICFGHSSFWFVIRLVVEAIRWTRRFTIQELVSELFYIRIQFKSCHPTFTDKKVRRPLVDSTREFMWQFPCEFHWPG